MTNRWTKDKIIENIKSLKCMQQSVVRKEHYALFGAAVRYFGSWKNAVQTAGFNYDDVKSYSTWDKNKIILKILDLDNKTDSHVSEHNKNLYLVAIRYFGSWPNAIKSVGLDYEQDIIKYKR